MAGETPIAPWLARAPRDAGPIYLALAKAIEAAIQSGELQPGERLPPQRAVAAALGVDFTTVTRAYGLARERGLVEGTVGRGTFVRARAGEDEAGLVDLSMNLPPPPEGLSLGGLLAETGAAVLRHADAATLMAYHPGAGTPGQKAAAAAWIAPCLETAPERTLVAPGAQAALAAVLSSLARPGDAVAAEPLTYPGIKALAAQLGLRLLPCPAEPGALDRLCRAERPAALYLVPTLQNPTAATLTQTRRREIAKIARAHDIRIVEDDPYGRLMEAPPQALAAFAPERTYYVATLSKTLSPGLRIAFLACPDAAATERAGRALRALSLMPAPLTAAVVARWIREGTAEAILKGAQAEARARRRLADEILPGAAGSEEAIHVWLDLPAAWSPERLRAAAQARGLALVGADAFVVGEPAGNGVRISLGGPAKRPVLVQALKTVAALVEDAPNPAGFVV